VGDATDACVGSVALEALEELLQALLLVDALIQSGALRRLQLLGNGFERRGRCPDLGQPIPEDFRQGPAAQIGRFLGQPAQAPLGRKLDPSAIRLIRTGQQAQKRVVLPAPFGPTSATRSPGNSRHVTPSRMTRSP